MGIGVEGDGHQRELVRRVSKDSGESTSLASGNDGLSDDGDVKKYRTLADMYETLVGPPSGRKPPARKRPRSDLEVDTPTAKANNASEGSIVKMMKVPS